ncbi:MAG: winged helix-turn-helix transcriptional regulator [Leucobacter sp.]|nr:winged helix-turn-helix transcriptional regulator [Leucobacter sp.]
MAAQQTNDGDPGTGSSAERLWSTSVGNDLAFLLARANALSLARMHTVLAPFGLRTRSYSVLSIAASDARPSQRELSDFLRLDPSQIVSLIDQLEGAGLVRREPDPRDRRANVVVATDAGRALVEEARRTVIDSDRAWFAVLSEDEREQLFSALHRLATGAAAQFADA